MSDATTQPNAAGDLASPFPHVMREGVAVSVICSYFNKESTIYECIGRLRRQSPSLCTPQELEIIVIDDGSEGTAVRRKLSADVIYLWQRRCLYGVTRARNTGAKLANGKYLVFLDADVLVGEGYLDGVLRGFRDYGERVVQCGYLWGYGCERCPDPRTEFGVWEKPNRVTNRFFQVAAGNMAVARAVLLEAGGFDEDMIYGGVEDLAFGYKLSRLPWTGVVFNTDMEGWHVSHPPGGAHLDVQKTWEVARRKCPEFYEEYVRRGRR